MTKAQKVQLVTLLVAVVGVVGPLLVLWACATDRLVFSRWKQSLPAGEGRTVDFFHVANFEHMSADLRIRSGKKILVPRFSFDGTTSDTSDLTYHTVVSSNQNMVAVVRISQPRVVYVLYDFSDADLWWHMRPYDHGRDMLAKFQTGFPDTIFALYGSNEAGMIMRGEM